MSDRDLSSAEPFDDFVQDRGDTSPVQNFDDEVSRESVVPSVIGDPEAEDGEELFGDNLERDYRPIPVLDSDGDVLDEDDSDAIIPRTMTIRRGLLRHEIIGGRFGDKITLYRLSRDGITNYVIVRSEF